MTPNENRNKEELLAVDCSHVTKIFGASFKALDDVSLQIKKGTLLGLIGADGAGKTTLIRILASLLLPTKGEVKVLGYDVHKDFRKLRHYIGYMPGKFSLYSDLSVNENLNVFATLYGTKMETNYELFSDLYEQLAPFGKRKAGNLSGGMKQKLALCCALVHRPDILLLDEPTTGVDPVSRKVFWDILTRLRKEFKMPIIVSTPYMDEAFRCDRVALIQNGKIISEDNPQGLVNSYPYKLWGVLSVQKGKMIKELRSLTGVQSVYSFGDTLHLTFDESCLSTEEIVCRMQEKGFKDITIKAIDPTIEDYFLAKTVEEKE